MEKEIYNGFEVKFDKKQELWYALVDEDGKPAKYDSSDNRVSDASLKKLKEKLDVMKRSKFERRTVFIRSGRYMRGGGEDEKYLPMYTEAVITSVSPNGNINVVKKGEKHSEKFGARWSRAELILDTPANRKLIAEIEAQGEAEWKAEREQKKLREKLKCINGEQLFEEVYGKKLSQL